MRDQDRQFLIGLFEAAVAAADPYQALRAHLPKPPKGRVIVIGAGKGSAQLAAAFEEMWQGPLEGVVVKHRNIPYKPEFDAKATHYTLQPGDGIFVPYQWPHYVQTSDSYSISLSITWKSREEKKVAALIAAGYSSDFNGEAYRTVAGQNSNNSIRVSDGFMRAVEEGGKWETRARTTGELAGTHEARDLWRMVAEAAWACSGFQP